MQCAPRTPLGEYLTDSIYSCAHFPSGAVQNTISVVLLIIATIQIFFIKCIHYIKRKKKASKCTNFETKAVIKKEVIKLNIIIGAKLKQMFISSKQWIRRLSQICSNLAF